MTLGSDNNGNPDDEQLDRSHKGDAFGRPAQGELEGNSYSTLGNPGMRHWQAGYVSQAGLDERSSVFFAAIEMTRMPMVITDPNQPDDPIVFVNKAFLDMTGYEEDQVVGQNCRMLQGEETDPETVAEIRKGLREQRAVAVDILNYKADGSKFWCALFIGPIFSENGELLYFFASQVDITQRRLSEQSFRQAQKMEAIGQLTAGLAHDFNNLLQVVTGNLEVAEVHARGNPALTTAIANAQRATERGGKLTQQLLTFARKQRLDPRRLNLNALVMDFSEMATTALGNKVELRLDLAAGLPYCALDAIHMEMALLNVLLNARDAMPEGGKITVATSVLEARERTDLHHVPPGQYVVICVIDEGEGMSPDIARRAVEPFFTTKGPGTGLGLAMVHGFVQQSHGRLEIESEIGKGTIMRMIFPVDSGRPIPPSPANQTSERQDSEVSTILLVEDSEDVRHVTEAHLCSLGYRVLTAASGEEALRLLQEHGPVDLLFADVMMPGGINGLVLAERVRERYPGVPVLLATGYSEELANQGVNTSAFPVVSKPYRRAEIAERIRVILDQRDAASRLRADNFRHEG
jgi:PAS domain S-box-containing protein